MHVVHPHVNLRVFMIVKIHAVVFWVDSVYTGSLKEHNIPVQNIRTLIPEHKRASD
jgi:hypothetical protein